MSLLLAFALAQAGVIAPASPIVRAVPATDWSCTLENAEGARFRLSGRLDEVPAGWDPNRSRPTRIDGDAMPVLRGRASFTPGEASEHFREYQIGIGPSGERYHVNLMLRRGGAGVAYVTRFVSNQERQPYWYHAAGLCTSQFDVAAQGDGQ